MKTIITLIISLMLLPQLIAQEIKAIQAYARLSGTRIIAITDQGTRIYMKKEGWQDVPLDELPEGKVKHLDAYHKLSGSSLMAVLSDESIWSYNDNWESLTPKGLPKDYKVKAFKPYTKFRMTGGTTSGRAFVVLENNDMYRYTENGAWESLHKTGLPQNLDIIHISSFQQPKMMSFNTGIVITTSDQSIYYRVVDDKKWSKYKAKQLPAGYEIQAIDCYLKSSVMGRPEGRIILAMKDGSIWWSAEKDDNWSELKVKGLPKDYRIKSLKVFQKGMSPRVLILLEDNTIWWYANDEFQQVDTSGLWK